MNTPVTELQPVKSEKNGVYKRRRTRNLLGFWLLGLCNNYPYVIMISAAFDLLSDKHYEPSAPKAGNGTNSSEPFCNSVSTGAILLADILPSLAVKLVAPFMALEYNIRVIIVVVLSASSFIITSLSTAHWITFLGVICASFSSGLGEVTFLSFSSYFDKDVISTWSSGTGGAGVVGALSYAALTHGLSVSRTLQVMIIFPLLMAVTFWFLIVHTKATQPNCCRLGCHSENDPMLDLSVDSSIENTHTYTLKEKIYLVKPLIKYMVPLALVYFAEYFINQGLMELIYFPNASKWLNHKEQYRWYQVDYQIGVLISRSSVNLLQVNKLWILPLLQALNLTFLLFESYFYFLPSIWIVLAIIFYEGLLGGCAYVNTFYKISQEVPEQHKQFSLGVASLGDSFGIALAGVTSLPVHKALCRMHS